MSEQTEKDIGDGFGVWCILELLGHVKLAGFVTEEELFGGKIGRVDIPSAGSGQDPNEGDEMVTQYFGGGSVYRLTPVSEDIARAFASRNRPRPVQVWELALPAPEPRDDPFEPFDDHDIPLEDEEEEYFEEF